MPILPPLDGKTVKRTIPNYIDKHDDSKNYPDGFPNSPCPTIFNRKLLVNSGKLLGNIACCLLVFDFLAQQLTDRHLEYLGKSN